MEAGFQIPPVNPSGVSRHWDPARTDMWCSSSTPATIPTGGNAGRLFPGIGNDGATCGSAVVTRKGGLLGGVEELVVQPEQ